MEFLDGEDLDHRLRRIGRMPAAKVVHIVKQVASALAATHAKGIVHRDLKPGNIYLLEVAGETDFVKVLDFGISKVRSATTKLTQATSVMGTPNYMSPEQALGRVDEIDERTDQWALACIAWECLSGEGPFVGENVPSILFQVVHEPPSALVPKVAGLRPQVEEVLLRAVAKDKRDRFSSVNDFALALEAAVVGSVTAATSSVSVTAQLPSVVSLKTTTFTQASGELGDDDDLDVPPTRPKWHLALAAGAAVVLVLGAFMLFRPRPPLINTRVAASPAPSTLPAQIPPAFPPNAAPPVAPQVDLADKEQSPAPPSESKANAKKSPPDSKSAGNPLGGKRHQSGKRLTKKKDGEGEDQWRVE
jgi:serine/threonine-protein kinase